MHSGCSATALHTCYSIQAALRHPRGIIYSSYLILSPIYMKHSSGSKIIAQLSLPSSINSCHVQGHPRTFVLLKVERHNVASFAMLRNTRFMEPL